MPTSSSSTAPPAIAGATPSAATATSFERFFAASPPASLGRLTKLTPADFALVQRRATFVGQTLTPDTLVAMLAAEGAGRDGARRIGFAA